MDNKANSYTHKSDKPFIYSLGPLTLSFGSGEANLPWPSIYPKRLLSSL